MTEFESTFERFKEELGSFLLKIQTIRVLDVGAFQRLEEDSCKLARDLRTRPLVPKSVLKEIRFAIKTLDAEAPYMRDKKDAMLEMAGKLEMTFDLILLGEDHGDRSPDLPRIV